MKNRYCAGAESGFSWNSGILTQRIRTHFSRGGSRARLEGRESALSFAGEFPARNGSRVITRVVRRAEACAQARAV